jgi:hypothetical protein
METVFDTSAHAAQLRLVTTETRFRAHQSQSRVRDGGVPREPELLGCDPAFFLASVDGARWIPRVLTISSGASIVGFLFAKERKFAGLHLGLIYADDVLGMMIAAKPGLEEQVFEAGLSHLMFSSGAHGLRLLVPPSGYAMNAIRRLTQESPLDVHYGRSDHHTELPLGDSYEAFLKGLGDKTRRNFRYYRRRFESRRHLVVPQMDFSVFEQAAYRLEKLNVIGAGRNGIGRAMRMLKTAKRPLLMGLRHENGEWLSILGGWYEGDRVVVFMQMNNEREFPQESLCIVARSYLIEAVIQDGFRKLVFWAGVGGPIARYCVPVPALGVYLDARTPLWRTTRRVVALTASLLPRKASELANWVSPAQV